MSFTGCFGKGTQTSKDSRLPHEVFEENVRLKSKIEIANRGSDRTDGKELLQPLVHSHYIKTKVWKRYVKCVIFGMLITAAVFTSYFIWSAVTINNRQKYKDRKNELHMHFGAKHISQCQEQQKEKPDFRKTFPDIGYAMFGYDVIEGYPNSNGHDPGFTYPIFSADYSSSLLTSDCRYLIPSGLVVIPDVSCVTSFSSSIIRNSFELQKSFATSVHAKGGYLGFSFSASSSYKKTSSEVSTGEKVYVTSSAKCSYYFSKIDPTQPPPLHPSFVRWIKALEKNLSDGNLLAFVKSYGTHFVTSMVFGARFIKQHRMTAKSYKTASSSDISVSVQASYSGLVSVSGGFNLDKSQREAASKFSKEVETTTVTVGAAPPSNGDAGFWASSVKENPVPTSYNIEPIAELFTDVFMKGSGINYDLIRQKLVGIEKRYCLQLLDEGTVNTCDDSALVGILIRNFYLEGADHPHQFETSESSCISKCFEDRYCLSISYIPKTSTCQFHDGESVLKSTGETGKNGPKSLIFPTRIDDLKSNFKVNQLRIKDPARDGSASARDLKACKKICLHDSSCDVFSFCYKGCSRQTHNCKIYSSTTIKDFEEAQQGENIETYFIYHGNRNDSAGGN